MFGRAPNLQELNRYDVNRRDDVEVVWSPLYDTLTYDSAGQTSLQFFTTPQGQGGKTFADSNMELAGSLPSPKQMLITAIEVFVHPGINPGRGGDFANIGDFWNDLYAVGSSGWLDFFIGSKSYVQDAPLNIFPSGFRLAGAAALADATTAAADLHSQIDYATFAGRPYVLEPYIRIISTQNFNVTLRWPTAVPLPSGQDARVGVRLLGWEYRLSQ